MCTYNFKSFKSYVFTYFITLSVFILKSILTLKSDSTTLAYKKINIFYVNINLNKLKKFLLHPNRLIYKLNKNYLNRKWEFSTLVK